MRIAHLSAEVAPFAKTGGLGDVVGALPKAQKDLGLEPSIWMPLYRRVWTWFEEQGRRPEWVCDPIELGLGFRPHGVGLLRTWLPGTQVPVYLVGHDPYFDRASIYGSGPDGGDDGLLRYALFVRAAMAFMVRLDLVPDVIHAHDWHAALAPMALAWDSSSDGRFRRTGSVFTIHNGAYQGRYGHDGYHTLGLPRAVQQQLDWSGHLNLMKGALLSADAVTTVSPGYRRELLTSEGGFGLDAMYRHRASDFLGLLNGIDDKVWNPAVDSRIPRRYDISELAPKWDNRRALLQLCGMQAEDTGFVVGAVGRLVRQKGWDLLFSELPALLADGIRFVFLGSGEAWMEDELRRWSARAPGRFHARIGYDDDLAHLIEAGADTFLMPSRFEPCGLNQMYSMAYGTPPIVRRTGGLADTVVGFDGRNVGEATGFVFERAEPAALRETIRFAARCFRNPLVWTRLARNGMGIDWSWRRAAERYSNLYERVLARKRAA